MNESEKPESPKKSPSWDTEVKPDKKINEPAQEASQKPVQPPVKEGSQEPPKTPEPKTTTPRKVETYTEPEAKTSKGGAFLFGFGIVLLIVVACFYGLLMWGLISGDVESNPLFEALGIEESGLQTLLITLTNFIFGFLVLIFLIATLSSFFRWAMLPKTSVNKSKTLFTALGMLMLFVISTGAWFSLYYFITQFVVSEASAEIDNTLIITRPTDVVSLSSPVTVEFDLTQKLYEKISPERIRQINWDFEGDEKVDASGAAVTYTFNDRGENNGRFPVTAEIFYIGADEKELSFKSVREVIVDNETVVPVILADPEVGSVPLDVTLSAADSYDPDGQVTLYEWDLDNDGEFELKGEDKFEIKETFAKVGEFPVSLRVTGTNNQDKATVTKVITANTPPSDLKAVIGTKDPLEGYPPLRIEFDGSNSFVKEGKIMKYEWLVEGETEVVPNRKLRRVFRDPGEYKIILTVENDLGERQQDEVIVSVSQEEIDPELDIRTTPAVPSGKGVLRGSVPFEVTFDSSGSVVNNPVEWRWDFQNDGVVDDFAQATQYVFRDPGTYKVKLEIVDAKERTYEKIQLVEVSAAGTMAIIKAEPAAGDAPLKVTFDGSASRTDKGEIVNYIWSFPNQDPINHRAQIDYLFREVGNYQVGLEILTSEGQLSEDTIIVSARAPSLKASFEATPKAGSTPLNVTFRPQIPSGVVQEYFWDFGDGNTRRYFRPETVSYTYTKPGTYNAILRITDRSGLTAEHTEVITVQ